MASGAWRDSRALVPSWITRKRAGRASRAAVVSVPHSTSRGGAPAPPSTTPYPRIAVPGSMPSTFTGALSGLGLSELRGVDVEVGGDAGDVVQLFEGLHELENALRVGPFDFDRVLRHHGELGRIDGETLGAERLLHGMEAGRRRGDE